MSRTIVRSTIVAPIAALAGLIAVAASASAAACPAGYHKVKVQGNWICASNAPASNNLATKTGPSPSAQIKSAPARSR